MLSQAAIPGIILAAGSSRRMGGNKLLLMFRGKPILQHVIDAAQRSSLSPLILVLGADSDDLRSQINPGSLLIANNPDLACGYGSSLQAGLKALNRGQTTIKFATHFFKEWRTPHHPHIPLSYEILHFFTPFYFFYRGLSPFLLTRHQKPPFGEVVFG